MNNLADDTKSKTCECQVCQVCLVNAKMRSDYYANRFMHERDTARKELDETKEMLFKATQMISYIQFRCDDSWRLYPYHQVNSLLVQLPKLPDVDL